MTLKEIDEKYGNTLSAIPENGQLKRELFSPILSNLYENKVIYHERNTIIAEIDRVVFDHHGMHFFTKSAVTFNECFPRMTPHLEKPFRFMSSWSFLRYSEGSFSPYSGWILWPDPGLVRQTIELVKEGRWKEACELTIFK